MLFHVSNAIVTLILCTPDSKIICIYKYSQLFQLNNLFFFILDPASCLQVSSGPETQVTRSRYCHLSSQEKKNAIQMLDILYAILNRL